MTVMAFAYKRWLQFAQGNRTEERSGRRTTVVWVLATVLYLMLSGAAVAEDTGTQNVLESVEFSALSISQVQLVLTMARPASNPLSFTIDNPARIALDFPDTSNGGVARSQKIGVGMLESMNVIEAGGRTRVVFNLTQMAPYQSRVEGNRVIVTLWEPGSEPVSGTGQPVPPSEATVAVAGVEQSAEKPAEKPAKAMATPQPDTIDVIKVAGIVLATRQKQTNKTPPAPVSKPAQTGPGMSTVDTQRNEPASKPVKTGPGIVNIDFRRNETGGGRIMITLTDPSIPVDLRQEGGQIIVDFLDSELPSELERRLDVVDFGTPIKTIETRQQGNNVRMVISPLGAYDHLAYQSDRLFTIEVNPVTKAEQERREKDKRTYTGDRLSLNFQDIEVRSVLQLIADFTGINVVVSDTVTGNLTLRLKNVPWDQALDIVLTTKGLAMRQNGNVMLVAPSEELAAREKLELESQKQLEELLPLYSEFIQVNYAKAADLAELISNPDNSMLTPERGSVAIDERTNTLLVQDIATKLTEIRQLVIRLDVPVRQVLIEARVVIANNDFSRDLGVRFGATGVREHGDGVIVGSGSLEGNDGVVNEAIDNIRNTGQPFPVNVPALGDRLLVDLAATNPAGTLALSILDSDYLLDLELTAMQAENRGEIISSPRVITSNHKEAVIKQGVEIPYLQASSSGATNVSFRDAVLSLRVTPQITPNDHIILDLAVNKDSVGEIFAGVPSINTREVSTQVLVDNGETVVLGGVYE
ncbi:MAG: type IV pilus secretin PilQ, partial [Gammaproteobacteria bacterium]